MKEWASTEDRKKNEKRTFTLRTANIHIYYVWHSYFPSSFSVSLSSSMYIWNVTEINTISICYQHHSIWTIFVFVAVVVGVLLLHSALITFFHISLVSIRSYIFRFFLPFFPHTHTSTFSIRLCACQFYVIAWLKWKYYIVRNKKKTVYCCFSWTSGHSLFSLLLSLNLSIFVCVLCSQCS